MNWTKLFFALLIFANLLLAFLSGFYELFSKAALLASSLYILLALPQAIYILNNNFKTLAWNTALVSVFLVFVEILFFFKLVEHPQITTWTMINEEQYSKIEFLEESPYIKFRPNSLIKSMGYRGEDFTYFWVTDALGFKNSAEMLKRPEHDFIALGDSFTESMGVSVRDTWASRMTMSGLYSVYNSGVQGYSASQMLGVYKILMSEIKHKGIIIGTLPTIYTRELKFDDASIHEMQQGTDGIASIARGAQNSFLTSFIRTLKHYVLSKNLSKNLANNKYKEQILSNLSTEELLKTDPLWNQYVNAIKQLVETAHLNDMRVILVQFPYRHEIYFTAEEQGLEDFNQTQYYVELNLLKKELPRYVEILDLFSFLKTDYVNKAVPLYFEIDGHMNEYGNKLVAKYILNYLNQPVILQK